MESFTKVFKAFATKILEVLPRSPFRQFLNDFAGIPYLGYLNWFVPVSGILKVLVAWLAAVAAYYLWSILLRWLKAIGG